MDDQTRYSKKYRGSTSAVGLLGGGLVLTETDSGPLGAGEILWQGHIQDLVVQRVTVCRDTEDKLRFYT